MRLSEEGLAGTINELTFFYIGDGDSKIQNQINIIQKFSSS